MASYDKLSGDLSDPSAWPAPFRLSEGEAGIMHAIEPDHRVRHGSPEMMQAA